MTTEKGNTVESSVYLDSYYTNDIDTKIDTVSQYTYMISTKVTKS